MKVLVAIDNKPSSQAIIDALVKMRWYEGTEIHLLTVLDSGVEYGTSDKPAPNVSEIEGLAVELHRYLGQCDVTFIARHGDPRAAILEAASQINADLIVLGSNCKNTLERLLIGSVCQAVLNGSTCPVIVAKTPCSLAREESPGYKNILLPIDSSPFSDVAVKWLGNFRWAADTTFILSAVVESDTDFDEVRESLKNRAVVISKLLQTEKILMEIVTGEPRAAIIGLAQQYYADLIVMGSHGRTGLKKLILGNVSQSISQEAPCAVAIVRGILPSDNSWTRTGAFSKTKALESAGWTGGGGNTSGRPDISVHIMPSGM
jgi:nucleotide-binding universal stress UspA family protein